MAGVTYFSGGTTGTPKQVYYSKERWQISIENTAAILNANSVGNNSRVLVCQPFAPWAIGQVFCEAAISCGADTYAIGLFLGSKSFADIIHDINPTHICGTARNLIKWQKHLSFKSNNPLTIFTAGETLTPALRGKCIEEWCANVVDVYGMSEFDTVAAELPGQEGLILVPSFKYAIKQGNQITTINEGISGELLIKNEGDNDWHFTGDNVAILHRSLKTIWPNSWAIHFLSRVEPSIVLPDGTIIKSSHIQLLIDKYKNIDKIQVSLITNDTGEELMLSVLSEVENLPFDSIIDSLLQCNIDLQDCLMHNVISRISVNWVKDEHALYVTERGKIPMFIN